MWETFQSQNQITHKSRFLLGLINHVVMHIVALFKSLPSSLVLKSFLSHLHPAKLLQLPMMGRNKFFLTVHENGTLLDSLACPTRCLQQAAQGPEEFRVNKWITYLKSHLEKCLYLSLSTINYDLESDDLENDDLENDDLENDDLEKDDLENERWPRKRRPRKRWPRKRWPGERWPRKRRPRKRWPRKPILINNSQKAEDLYKGKGRHLKRGLVRGEPRKLAGPVPVRSFRY